MVSAKRNHHGFTLLEVLVVLVVVTITIMAIGVRYSRSESDITQEEAHRLALLLRYASDVARTSGQPVAWSVSNDTYTFSKLEPNRQNWRLVMDDESLRKRSLPENVHIRNITLNGTAMTRGTSLIFSPSGLNPDFTITLTNASSQVNITGDLAGNIVDQAVVSDPL